MPSTQSLPFPGRYPLRSCRSGIQFSPWLKSTREFRGFFSLPTSFLACPTDGVRAGGYRGLGPAATRLCVAATSASGDGLDE